MITDYVTCVLRDLLLLTILRYDVHTYIESVYHVQALSLQRSILTVFINLNITNLNITNRLLIVSYNALSSNSRHLPFKINNSDSHKGINSTKILVLGSYNTVEKSKQTETSV